MDTQHLESSLKGKSFLNPDQQRDLDRQIQAAEWAVDGRSRDSGEKVDISVNGTSPEPDLARELLDRLMAMKDDGATPDLNGMERNYLRKRVQELEQDITHTMPTHEMMERPLPGNIDAHMAWEQHNINNILLWRNMRRALDPLNDEPHFTSVEILRTATPPRGDARKFWRGYDNVSWQTEQDKVHADVDDHLYLAFLRLYAKKWSVKSITKELNMSDAQYERALERLNEVPDDDEPEEEEDIEVNTSLKDSEPLEEEFWLVKEMREYKVSKSRFIRDAQIGQKALNQWIANGFVDPKYRNIVERVMSKYRPKEEAPVDPELETVEV